MADARTLSQHALRFTNPAQFLDGIAGLLQFLLLFSLFAVNSSAAIGGGSISGTVRDSSDALIAGATVTAVNTETAVRVQITTNGQGFYSFQDLPVGRYDVSVQQAGFKPYRRTGITINTNGSVIVDAVLDVGAQTQAVTVRDSAIHAETSDTQMGEVVTSAQATSVPLNGRSYTDLLALQPGVVPVTSLTSDTQQDVGVSALSPSGDLNPGTVSINGQREFSNGFTVNGSDTEEDVNSGTAIIPNLDSIAEFRILTSNFDAEYGGHSGGQINVVTKSGTNALHGDAFEFVRNAALDARNFFSPTRGAYDQNQFGGTLGGPIRKNKAFFFADYQGTRLTQGIDTGEIPVPSVADRAGDLADLCPNAQQCALTGTVTGQPWANVLAQKLGYPVNAGENYYTPGCTSPSQCVFPNAVIPMRAWSAPATNLLQYIPVPNVGDNEFSTSAFDETLRNDKGAVRFDDDSRWGFLSAYYFLDDATVNNPYPVAQSGANVPGFNALYVTRAQLVSLGDTITLKNSAIDEFHFSYLRDYNDLGKPIGGVGVSLASQGFVTGPGTPGIVALNPAGEGVENVDFNAFSIGTNANELRQANNTFQWIDNFSKVVGRHAMKFGVEFHYDQINSHPIAQFNGNFIFSGSETGSDFADFLIGVPSIYNQSELLPFYARDKYFALYAQDSWRLRSNLTLNYGLRWDRIEPWYEKNNGISTFQPGAQSVVFPGAPPGILYPGDPGVSRTLGPAGNLDFAPRLGIAYAPNAKRDSLLGKILGGTGESSLRASYGLLYSQIEALSIGILAANPPFGITYSSPGSPMFATPFVTAATQQNLGQVFPVALVSQPASSGNPNTSVDWSQFAPITGVPGYATTNRIPFVEEYMASFQRQFGSNTLLSVSYLGAQGHRLLVLVEANPGNPALCLSLSQKSEVAPSSPTCQPFDEDLTFTSASNQVFNGTRGPLGSNFGSNTLQETIGSSDYNALQISLKHTSGRLTISAGYTYGKSTDDASNLGEEVDPLNPSLSYGLSSFDVRHNFVVSYNYRLPIERIVRVSNRWTQGWEISGVTHFGTGLPVTLATEGDNSLLGTYDNGINNFTVDEPDYTAGPLNLNHNPQNGQPYFNTSLFQDNAPGTPGNVPRRFFSGPGLDNFDMALLKTVRLTESKSLLFRVEAFNVFNTPQFFGPQTVDGNVEDTTTFGHVTSADAPRLMQLGIKFVF